LLFHRVGFNFKVLHLPDPLYFTVYTEQNGTASIPDPFKKTKGNQW
jgi:hypothetical protein